MSSSSYFSPFVQGHHAGCHSPSSDSLLSLVSCSIWWHHPSIRAVSARRSFRNQFPSRGQAGVAWTPSPWVLQFPASRLGSGGGSEEGSKAGSRVSAVEVDILDAAEVFLIGCWSMGFSGLLAAVLFDVWLVQFVVFFSVGVVSWDSFSSVSVFCLEAMLLSRLRLQRRANTGFGKMSQMWPALTMWCKRVQTPSSEIACSGSLLSN